MDSKSARNSIFAPPFFRTCFALDFGAIFGRSKPEKHWFYQGKTMIFVKSALANKAAKSIDFRVVLQPKIHWKSLSFWTCKRYCNFLQIYIRCHKCPCHFGLLNTPANHLKTDSGSFWRRSGIVLVLQGRIWMNSERLGLDFSLIWARFWLYFRVDRAWLLQTIARWTICISCCTQHGIVAFTLHFLTDIWCGGVRIALGIT